MDGAALRLRETLAERFPGAMPLSYRTVGAVATGIGTLDGFLPNGGLPRGRLTAWQPGGGSTAVLRSACRWVVGRGERAAWIDGSGLVVGDHWPSGPLLVRPGGEAEALECAEELSRCGGFGLVVLEWGRSLGPGAVRLGRAVREGGGALVTVNPDTAQAQLRIGSRLSEAGWYWVRGPFGEVVDAEMVTVRVEARSLGWSGWTEFRLPVFGFGQRLGHEPDLVDRRGARRESHAGLRGRPGSGPQGRRAGGG